MWTTAPPCLCVEKQQQRLMIATNTDGGNNLILCSLTVLGSTKSCERIWLFSVPSYILTESEGLLLIPWTRTRPANLAGFPVQLRRLTLSRKTGASARLFFSLQRQHQRRFFNCFWCFRFYGRNLWFHRPLSLSRRSRCFSPKKDHLNPGAACFVFEPPWISANNNTTINN